MVDAAVSRVDVEKAAGNRSCQNVTPVIDLFFEAAFTAALAGLFPAVGFFFQTHAFLTNSDFSLIGPMPSILQSMS